ncbi:MAG: hypothetical protein Q4C91_18195 [Eubacteriales bacterium]|nr:hypothetical protein [Eubacteriales bacterium]
MLKNSQKIDALAWKARQENVSYGVFSATLTDRKKKQIYEEYEAYICAKQKAEEKRLKNIKKVKKNRK